MKFNISHINNPILDIQQRVIEKLRPSVAIRYDETKKPNKNKDRKVSRRNREYS